jgi:hypothetical protein
MKSWLTKLVKALSENKEIILALAERKNLAKVALFDDKGQLLTGDLGSNEIDKKASDAVIFLKSGESIQIAEGQTLVLCEKLGGQKALAFWQQALDAQQEAWAAWLLTITKENNGNLTVVRHIMAASGPFTSPRLPSSEDKWSLLPLNAGLGRMFVFGDDELALETAALGARTGLKVTLGSVNPLDLDIRAAHSIGDFDLMHFSDWSDLNASNLAELGIKPGVMVLVTTPNHSTFLEDLKNCKIGWLGLAGEAALSEKESGLFPKAVTPSQRALGLVAAMLDGR